MRRLTVDARPRPEIAAVIATYNRAELLRQTLDSLTRQTVGKDAFEVIVVNDGSADDTEAVVAGFGGSLRLRSAYQQNAGLASARNHGLYLSCAPIVLFLDDDDVADTSLLERHLDTHGRYPADSCAVLGYTGLDAAIASDPLMHFVTEVGCFLYSYPAIKDGDLLDFSYFWGGRTSCKRRFLTEWGVFNPIFRFGCEDIELGYRLSQQGLKVVYNAAAITTTVRKVSFDDFCRRLTRQGNSNLVFSQLHGAPEVQQWCEVAEALETWPRLERRYDSILQTARSLDRLATTKLEMGFTLADGETRLLYEAYWAAFRASKIKGIIDASRRLRPIGSSQFAAGALTATAGHQ